jgi:histidyl-tRNA synthetase
MKIKRVRGTQDILDLQLQNFVLNQAKKHFTSYNYSQIETPIIEHTNLFVRSLGTHTDVVTKEMYTFTTEGGDEICLRPEVTASTMRAFLENSIEERPWKVFTYGPMFRHERPQKGRWRQFEQFNIEAIATTSIAQDAHFIAMIDKFFNFSLKLENYVLKLNFLGCLEDRKNHKESLKKYLDSIDSQLCEKCKKRKETNILRVFDCKNDCCQKLYTKAPKLTEHLCETCNEEWQQLQELLQFLSVNFIHDPCLVRGLDYYNKTVFEFSSQELGSQNAFCGGGRYELAKELGGKENVPSIGTAIGLGRLLLLVEKNQNELNIPHAPALQIIIPMTEEQHVLALLLANNLQSNNICSDILFESSLNKKMKKANKLGAQHVLILGEEEQKNGTVSIKNMQTGKSNIIKQTEAATFIK